MRSKFLSPFLFSILLAMNSVAIAQQPHTQVHPSSNKPANNKTLPPKVTSSSASLVPTIQLKREITGNLTYRFLPAGGAPTAPLPLPVAASADGIIALSPAASLPKGSVIEIADIDTGLVAHIPVDSSKVTALTAADFNLMETVLVTVNVQGKGLLTGAQVSLADAARKYSQTWLLKPSDYGVAQFSDAPMNEPLTLTVQNAADPPMSVTQQIPTNPAPTGYHWPPLTVTWPDAQSVSAPPSSVLPTTGASSLPTVPASQPGSPWGSLLSDFIGIIVVAAIGYGLYRAYDNGKLGDVVQKMTGINLPDPNAPPPAMQGSPFDRSARQPLQPITEGVSDPLFGGGAASPVVVSTGPRLVATAGTYAGSIFNLVGPSNSIGRDSQHPVSLSNDTNSSRNHATITSQNGEFMLIDNNSSNGTFVNGIRIPAQSPTILHSGDEVQIGMTRFRFEA